MQHLEEHIIDLYVLNPDLLQDPVRTEVRAHLGSCAGCRSVESFFRSFYEELNSGIHDPSPEIDIVLQRLLRLPQAINLVPYRPTPAPLSAGSASLTVLAARSSADAALPRYETIATLISSQDRAVLRFQRDNVAGIVTLYYDSPDPRSTEGVLVSVRGSVPPFVLDGRARAEASMDVFGKIELGEELLVRIRYPVASGKVTMRDGGCSVVLRSPDGGYRVNLRPFGNVTDLFVRSVARARPAAEVLLCEQGRLPVHGVLRDGRASLPLLNSGDEVLLRLYM